MKKLLIPAAALFMLSAPVYADDHGDAAAKSDEATEVTPGEEGPTEAVGKNVPDMDSENEGRPATETVGEDVEPMKEKTAE